MEEFKVAATKFLSDCNHTSAPGKMNRAQRAVYIASHMLKKNAAETRELLNNAIDAAVRPMDSVISSKNPFVLFLIIARKLQDVSGIQ